MAAAVGVLLIISLSLLIVALIFDIICNFLKLRCK